MATLTGKLTVESNDNEITIKVTDFSSGDIATQLAGFSGLDWRTSVEQVAVDFDYNGSTFQADLTDIPEEATDYVKGSYTVEKSQLSDCIAVKITDILGESVVLTEQIV